MIRRRIVRIYRTIPRATTPQHRLISTHMIRVRSLRQSCRFCNLRRVGCGCGSLFICKLKRVLWCVVARPNGTGAGAVVVSRAGAGKIGAYLFERVLLRHWCGCVYVYVVGFSRDSGVVAVPILYRFLRPNKG